MPSAASLGEEGQIKEDSQAVILAWRDIISTLTDLELRELVSPAERVLIRDFIDYVEAYHSKLNPFDHFAVCRDDIDLLNRRCEVIMREIASTEVGQGPLPFIPVEFPSYKRIYLNANVEQDHAGSWWITLGLYPGDTMTQAQEFWSKVNIGQLLALQNTDWLLEPNLHFWHYYNRQNANTSLAVAEYIELWKSDEITIASIWPDGAGSYRHHWDCLVDRNLISRDDGELIEALSTENNPWISIAPGLGISYTWSAARASQLDRDGVFVCEVKEGIREATETWGEVPDFCS